eukprot:4469606-Pleurochrysis_carterae.AAC.1
MRGIKEGNSRRAKNITEAFGRNAWLAASNTSGGESVNIWDDSLSPSHSIGVSAQPCSQIHIKALAYVGRTPKRGLTDPKPEITRKRCQITGEARCATTSSSQHVAVPN